MIGERAVKHADVRRFNAELLQGHNAVSAQPAGNDAVKDAQVGAGNGVDARRIDVGMF